MTLYLHRIAALGELLELHFILSCWSNFSDVEHLLAGWVLNELERTPFIPKVFPDRNVKIRRSDEDARNVWKLITDQPLRLSLAYIATVSPGTAGLKAIEPNTGYFQFQ